MKKIEEHITKSFLKIGYERKEDKFYIEYEDKKESQYIRFDKVNLTFTKEFAGEPLPITLEELVPILYQFSYLLNEKNREDIKWKLN